MTRSRLDPFTARRIERFIEEFRAKNGQLPTLPDFAEAGIEKEKVELAIKDEAIEELYVTLTNGVVMKGYKVRHS